MHFTGFTLLYLVTGFTKVETQFLNDSSHISHRAGYVKSQARLTAGEGRIRITRQANSPDEIRYFDIFLIIMKGFIKTARNCFSFVPYSSFLELNRSDEE